MLVLKCFVLSAAMLLPFVGPDHVTIYNSTTTALLLLLCSSLCVCRNTCMYVCVRVCVVACMRICLIIIDLSAAVDVAAGVVVWCLTDWRAAG